MTHPVLSRCPVYALVVCLGVPAALAAQARDVAGSKDSPLLKRYEGSRIVLYSENGYDSYVVPLGPSNGSYTDPALLKSQRVEGKVTRLTYLVPAGRSALEVIRNYEAELKAAGYRTLFQGSGSSLGAKPSKFAFASAVYGQLKIGSNGDFEHISRDAERDDIFLAAKLQRPQGDVHVALYAVQISPAAINNLGLAKTTAAGEVLLQVDIIESKPMETKMVSVSAAEMTTAIAEAGSVALYGIYFDTNSADLKEESTPALQEIAKLMAGQPKLRLLVVGHTDSVGTYESNLDLSTRRARAVVQALATRHAVDAKRLVPVGVSFASPVATNRTEDGKAKNRRVQLVEY